MVRLPIMPLYGLLMSNKHGRFVLFKFLCSFDTYRITIVYLGRTRINIGYDDITYSCRRSHFLHFISRWLQCIGIDRAVRFSLHLRISFINGICRCNEDIQKSILNLTYEELVTTENGLFASRALVNAIINRQIDQQNNVGSLGVPKLKISLHINLYLSDL